MFIDYVDGKETKILSEAENSKMYVAMVLNDEDVNNILYTIHTLNKENKTDHDIYVFSDPLKANHCYSEMCEKYGVIPF